MKYLPIALFVSLASFGCEQQNKTMDSSALKNEKNTVVGRDNSAVNKRDRDASAKTPFDQNENKADIGITANIRKSVVDTKMSINAQNVKIITQDGVVTLRGPVKTQEEKDLVEEIALSVAGVKTVESQLEVEKNL